MQLLTNLKIECPINTYHKQEIKGTIAVSNHLIYINNNISTNFLLLKITIISIIKSLEFNKIVNKLRIFSIYFAFYTFITNFLTSYYIMDIIITRINRTYRI